MATTKQWMRFFLDAGIPPDSAAHYAVTFEQNRMGLDMVGDLDKEYLRDLKITALGDIISILRAAKKHQDRTEREAAVAKREQVDLQGGFFNWSALKMTKCQITCKSLQNIAKGTTDPRVEFYLPK